MLVFKGVHVLTKLKYYARFCSSFIRQNTLTQKNKHQPLFFKNIKNIPCGYYSLFLLSLQLEIIKQ